MDPRGFRGGGWQHGRGRTAHARYRGTANARAHAARKVGDPRAAAGVGRVQHRQQSDSHRHPLVLLLTTGSAARTGIVAFAGLLPIAIAGVIGGAVVDRLGFKRSSIVADVASGVTVGLIPLLHFAGVLQFWHLLALAFCGGIFDVPGASARNALLPRLAARANMPLERANATYQLGQVFASVVGPLLAGVLILAIDAANVMYIDAASFFISAAVVAVGVTLPRSSRVTRHARARPCAACARGCATCVANR